MGLVMKKNKRGVSGSQRANEGFGSGTTEG